jgi:hypothetical protein
MIAPVPFEDVSHFDAAVQTGEWNPGHLGKPRRIAVGEGASDYKSDPVLKKIVEEGKQRSRQIADEFASAFEKDLVNIKSPEMRHGLIRFLDRESGREPGALKTARPRGKRSLTAQRAISFVKALFVG